MSQGQVSQLADAYLNLKPWPDVAPMLGLLKKEGCGCLIIQLYAAHVEFVRQELWLGGDIRKYSEHGSS